MTIFRFKPSKKSNKIEWPGGQVSVRVPTKFSPANSEKVDVMKHLLDLLAEEEVDTTFIELIELMSKTFQMRFQADAFTLIQQIDLKHKDA